MIGLVICQVVTVAQTLVRGRLLGPQEVDIFALAGGRPDLWVRVVPAFLRISGDDARFRY